MRRGRLVEGDFFLRTGFDDYIAFGRTADAFTAKRQQDESVGLSHIFCRWRCGSTRWPLPHVGMGGWGGNLLPGGDMLEIDEIGLGEGVGIPLVAPRRRGHG